MKQKSALIIYGGWEGHEPLRMAEIFQSALEVDGFKVEAADTLAALDDREKLQQLDLILPCWTMDKLSDKQKGNLLEAVSSGVGLGGFHGGMGDAFRGCTEYEWMVGGHFVGHPHVGEYTVCKTSTSHPITDGLPESFEYNSEQYYMLVDPGITVLADTVYTYEGRECTMPVVWIKHWGKGRVFYSALGHQAKEFSDCPHVMEMTLRGLEWAARAL